MTVKKKRKNRAAKKIVSIICLAIAIVLLIKVGQEVFNYLALKNQQTTVAEQLTKLEEENQELLETKAKLEDPNYITTYASGEYMFSKGDEKLFRLPSKD